MFGKEKNLVLSYFISYILAVLAAVVRYSTALLRAAPLLMLLSQEHWPL